MKEANRYKNAKGIIIGLFILFIMMLSACSGGAITTPMPTQLLIPVTPTTTPEQPTPTPTLAPAIAPGDLLPTPVRADIAHLSELEQEVALLAINQLINHLDQTQNSSATPQSIQVAYLTTMLWRSPLTDCEVTRSLGDSEISGFQLFLFNGDIVYDYHTDKTGQAVLCDQQSIDEVTGELLLLIDPVAAEMVAIAKRRLATELDLPSQRIQFNDIYATTWPDSSLGCPASDQIYNEAQIKGYRIVVSVTDRDYIFHTDFDGLIQCPAEQEVLPQDNIPTEEAPAEETPEA